MLFRSLITDDDTSIVLFIDNDQYAGAHAPYRMSYEDFQAAYQGILQAVSSGTISEERLNQSVVRILETKLEKF